MSLAIIVGVLGQKLGVSDKISNVSFNSSELKYLYLRFQTCVAIPVNGANSGRQWKQNHYTVAP